MTANTDYVSLYSKYFNRIIESRVHYTPAMVRGQLVHEHSLRR